MTRVRVSDTQPQPWGFLTSIQIGHPLPPLRLLIAVETSSAGKRERHIQDPEPHQSLGTQGRHLPRQENQMPLPPTKDCLLL